MKESMNLFNTRLTTLALSLLLLGGALPAVHAADAAPAAADPSAYNLREHYTKYEYRIPMRDGVRLFTVVYVPKDTSKSYPFLMQRTPYSAGVSAGGELHYGEDFYPTAIGPSREFERAGYIFVKQDVRGRFM